MTSSHAWMATFILLQQRGAITGDKIRWRVSMGLVCIIKTSGRTRERKGRENAQTHSQGAANIAFRTDLGLLVIFAHTCKRSGHCLLA